MKRTVIRIIGKTDCRRLEKLCGRKSVSDRSRYETEVNNITCIDFFIGRTDREFINRFKKYLVKKIEM